ncbi:phage tail protein I [Asticcacaulis machinosus]|uniref:Phage tail protein I n=1 Tax=Asticcacaulis machinosus TaxID=2984211 RepID=A0ABT5HGS0_9CAUL|nr:phage tail protein I [Asticcacaulis machinosus]MDC7675378.1 phage tail protein I [Asticcacaulis machinosus]
MSLLPPNSSPLERAVEAATDRTPPIPLRAIWDADTCPLHVLPWLAWALSIDNWSADWPEAAKRDRVRIAIALQRKKGTAQSVHDVVRAVGAQVAIREWFEMVPKGTPHTFELALNVTDASGAPASAEYIEHVINEVRRTKPVRSHFEFVQGLVAQNSIGIVPAARVATFARLSLTAA